MQSVSAQGNTNYFQPNVFPSGPNSMEFQKFGNYPVNLYAGLPDISIPLYTIEVGGLSVPITLSYHASGIRIPDVASWVGLGWSINTSGTISRNIMGLPDDNGYLQGDMRQVASLAIAGTPDNPTSDNYLDFFHATISTRGWDNMPDIYSYQIPGYSGKFFFDGTNKYKIEKIPFSPIKITGLTGLNGTGGFNITDDHGNKYTLGHTTTEYTGTPIGGGTPAMNGISSWMLEQMISQSKRDTINFSYTPDTFTFPDGLQESFPVEDDYVQGDGAQNPGYVSPILPPNILNMPSTVTEQQLSTISYKNGKVNFILSQQGRNDVGDNEYASSTVKSLDTIKVSAYNYGKRAYEVQKSIVFYKSYFNEGISGAQRLRLDSIQILDKAGSIMQHYRFTYNTTINLPAYGSLARDFWGYYNGKTTATDLIPQTTIQIETPNNINNPITNVTIGSNDPTSRNPDSNYMQANVLTRIDYPTGGYTTFSYQTNQYHDSNNNLQLAGGLRIQSISSYANPTSTLPVLVKTYQYNTARPNFITNGLPLLNNGIFQNTQTYRWWYSLADSGKIGGVQIAYSKRVRHFFAQPNEDLAPDAIPVAYSVVTEYNGTPAGNIGKTVYTYRDTPADNFQTADMTGIPITYGFFFARGQLSEKTTYMNKGSNTYQVVSDETHNYTAFPLRYYNGVGLAIGQNVFNDGYLQGAVAYPNQESPDDIAANTYPWAYYDIVSDDNYLTGTTNTTYDISDPAKYVTSWVTYNYDDTTHLQVVSTAHTDSKGNIRTTANKYPYNYSSGNAVIDTMVSHNMLSEAIEKTETYTPSTGAETTASQLNQYQFGNLAGSVLPYTISVLNIPTPVTNFVPSGVVSGALTYDTRYTQMISFDHFDQNNNIAQYTTRNATPVSIFWDYLGELPVAQIKNATNNNNTNFQVAYAGFETATPAHFSYNGTPITDVTAPTGAWVYPLSSGSVTLGGFDVTQSYILSLWSNNGAPTVYTGSYLAGTPLRTMNGWTYYEYTIPSYQSSITISGTSSIDEVRLYPTAAQMTTYNYDPSGLRSITDTKGEVNYFEYDPFQRLKNIKDWNGNIVKNYGYHIYDQIIPNDAIGATTFTRDNCPANTTPQSTTYSVPAAKYLSSTKTAANAEAQYDLKTNGQLLADNPAICGCPVQTVTFTLSNSTGITGFQAQFQGGTNPSFPFPSTGSTQVQVPVGNYTLYIGPVGSATHSFTYGAQTQSNVHSATFTGVVVATSGGNPTNVSIQ